MELKDFRPLRKSVESLQNSFSGIASSKKTIATNLKEMQHPFASNNGYALDHAEEGRILAKVNPRKEHLNSYESVHGGYMATMLDTAMAQAAQSTIADQLDKKNAVVADNFCSYILPANAGDDLELEAKVLAEKEHKKGKSLLVGSLLKKAGAVVSGAIARFAIVDKAGFAS